MGRLTSLKSGLTTLRPSMAYMPEGEKERNKARADLPWRKWYNSKRWKDLRWTVLLRDMFKCQRCGRLEANSSQLVANHKRPHHGNERLFWSIDNIETACKPCHDSVIQREEKGRGV